MFFPNLKKVLANFPIMYEIRELMEEECSRPDKKTSLQNRFAKLYLIRSEELEIWDCAPRADVSLQRLAQHVTLHL